MKYYARMRESDRETDRNREIKRIRVILVELERLPQDIELSKARCRNLCV